MYILPQLGGWGRAGGRAVGGHDLEVAPFTGATLTSLWVLTELVPADEQSTAFKGEDTDTPHSSKHCSLWTVQKKAAHRGACWASVKCSVKRESKRPACAQ